MKLLPTCQMYLAVVSVVVMVAGAGALVIPKSKGQRTIADENKIQIRRQKFTDLGAQLDEIISGKLNSNPNPQADPTASDYDEFFELFTTGIAYFSEGYYFGFLRTYKLLELNDFNSTLYAEVEQIFLDVDDAVFAHIVASMSVVSQDLPMEQIATIVIGVIDESYNILDVAQVKAEAVIERGDPTLLEAAKTIRLDAQYDMEKALRPTLNFLNKFFPRHGL